MRQRLLDSARAAKVELSRAEETTAEVPADDGSWHAVPVTRRDFEAACEALISHAWATLAELGRQSKLCWTRYAACTPFLM